VAPKLTRSVRVRVAVVGLSESMLALPKPGMFSS
jgi:hypothetical protein